MRKSGEWHRVLDAARKVCGKQETFTVHDLVEAAGISDGGEASAQQIASAWLAKLKTWGYVEKVGEIPQQGRRPLFTYRVTKEGMACEIREGKLEGLVSAVRAYQKARGTKHDAAAFQELIRVCDGVGP